MTGVVHARLPKKDIERLNELVKEGYYASISDALRYATRLLIKEHKGNKKIKHEELWKKSLSEANGHIELALEIFHRRLKERI